MKIQLIKTDNKFILVSDEEGIDGDTVLHKNGTIGKLTTALAIALVEGTNEGSYVDECRKVIAGIPELPSIDFSALSDEDANKIGWVDITYWSKNIYGEFRTTREFEEGFHTGFRLGFQKAQSLNDKKYSEEDLRCAFNLGYDLAALELNRDNGDYEKFIQSLSQQVWDVEVEMEYQNQDGKWGLYYPFASSAKDSRPKITNNSIKILKVL